MSAANDHRFDALADLLEGLGELRRDEPMARHTTFGIGGPADLYLNVVDSDALAAAATAARHSDVPLFVLGSGSNVLVGDAGIRGLVIENDAHRIDGPVFLDAGRARVQGESGASFAATSRRLCRAGYWGLEWAVGIPGTLGGAVVYNAGAYGGCLADVLASIEVLEPDGSRRTIAAEALSLEYRGSAFTRGILRDRVIITVTFQLRAGDPVEIMAHVAALDSKRIATQPRGRNAGSIFKNPSEHPAWWLIDQVGLRGARIGDAEISAKHANFFSNAGRAQAREVKQLMDRASGQVRERFGIELHPEVALIGEGF
jgi:UDP-N-acetylmuramate dehydrogenase